MTVELLELGVIGYRFDRDSTGGDVLVLLSALAVATLLISNLQSAQAALTSGLATLGGLVKY